MVEESSETASVRRFGHADKSALHALSGCGAMIPSEKIVVNMVRWRRLERSMSGSGGA